MQLEQEPGDVLVVGGGIGGMAAAILLAEAGARVRLIDVDPGWKVYGAGITITGPTLRAYKRLGMTSAIATQGAIATGSRIFRYDGQWIQDLDEPVIEAGLPATGGILRPVLHRIMQERVRSLPIDVRLGVTVDSLQTVGDGVEVGFSDGGAGRFGLVVGADSIFSRVRELMFPHMGPAEPTGQGCWRLSTRRPPGMERGEFYLGHGHPAGINRCGAEDVYLWMLTRHVPGDRHLSDAELREGLRAHLSDFGGNAAWIRDNMSDQDWINYRPLAARLQPRPWSNGRVVLLGDAVHATTPHLASGAGMAVESAIVLAEELQRSNGVEDALAAYEARRFPRCHDVVETSLAVGAMQLAGAGPEEVGARIGGALHRLAAPF